MCGRFGLNVKETSAEKKSSGLRVFDFQESSTTDDVNNFATALHRIMFSTGTRIAILPRQTASGDGGMTVVSDDGGSIPFRQHRVLKPTKREYLKKKM